MIWTPATDTICTICGNAFSQAERRKEPSSWNLAFETCCRGCDLLWKKSRPPQSDAKAALATDG